MTDLGDILQTLAPVLVSFALLAVVAVVAGRRQRKREEKP